MKQLKQLSLTLLLLITAAAGAWAGNVEAKIGNTEYATLAQAISSAQDGDIIQLQSDVALTTENYVDKGITVDFNGYIISTADVTQVYGIFWEVDMTFIDSDDTGRGGMKCRYGQVQGTEAKANLCGGRYDDPVEAILTGPYASFYNIPTSYEIVNINADGSADADGFISRVVRNYLNDTKTVATIPMPANDVTVNYTLVRDMQDQVNPVTFSGLPTTGDIIVKKGDDGKYQPIETLTIQLTDLLAAADAQNIIAADGITVTVERNSNNAWAALAGTFADFMADMQPGTYRLTATPKDENSPYEGTVTSGEFTLVEKYNLVVKPANDFSKNGLDNVTVGTEEITPDATTGKVTKNNIDPDTEVKLKAKRGYVIEKVEAKKTVIPMLNAATTENIGMVVCNKGHLHDAKTAVPAGCTAVGILGKVTGTGHGLILALKNATNQNWNTINSWTSVTTYVSTTLKVLPDDAARGTNLTSYTTLGETTVSNWAVAQKSDYVAIFTNLGSTKNSGGMTYDNKVNAYITTGVGGTAMAGTYWSATQDDDYDAWYFHASSWYDDYKTSTYYVRPVLGF